jgi:hypothetical protein
LSLIAQPNIDREFLIQFECEAASWDIPITNIPINSKVDIIADSGLSSSLTNTTSLLNGVQVQLVTSGVFTNSPYGTITLEINTGSRVYIETVYLIPCCDKDQLPLKEHVIISETVSDLQSRGISSFDNFDYWIMNELILDQDFSFDNSVLYLQFDAKISTRTGVNTWANFTKFLNFCEFRWDGFFLEGQNTLFFQNIRFEGATTGLFCENSNSVEIIDCFFENNILSLSLIDPVDNTTNISGTTFFTPSVSFVDHSPVTAVDLTVLEPFSFNANYPTPPEQLHVFAKGAIFEFGNPVVLPEKHDNKFINANMDTNTACAAFFALNSDITSNYNFFDLVYYSFFGFNSTLTGYNNHFSNTHWGILSSGCSHDFHNNTFTASTLMIFLNPNSSESSFTNNQFTTGINKIIGDDGTYNFIYENNIHGDNASVFVDSCYSPPLLTTNQTGLIISSNTFEFGGVELVNCPNSRIFDNDFTNTNPTHRSFGAGAIFVENCDGAQIKNNTITNRFNGIQGKGILNNIIISCNSFDDCDYGMYFPANTTVTDQGSTILGGFENTWGNMPSGSFSVFNHSNNASLNFFRYCAGNCIPTSFNNISVVLATFPYTNCVTLQKNFETTKRELKVYPNPSTDNFIVEQNESIEVSVKVVNALGQLIFEKQFFDTKNYINHDFPAGVYTILVVSTTGKLENNSTLIVY